MAVAFVVASMIVFIGGVTAASTGAASGENGHPALMAVPLAFPVTMTLAPEVENALAVSPSSGRSGASDPDSALHRSRGQARCRASGDESTLTAEVARASVGGFLFAALQPAIILRLIAASASGLQAGPGLLKALAREQTGMMRPKASHPIESAKPIATTNPSGARSCTAC